MKKNDLIKISIDAEIKLLEDIEKNPNKFLSNDILFNALKDQSSFSKYSDSEYKIISYSLNTQKTYANKYHIRGYGYLNKLRIQAYEKLSPKKIKSLNKEAKDPHSQINSLMKSNLLLTNLVVYLNQNLSNFANKSNSLILINEYEEINRYIQDSLTFIQSIEDE
ncbi:hypothetical protein [Acinetobacter lwoffii]|jgi:hypothetical protein|uniref:hypothetical protein n=1 Tax=Acinetobacter lwoffii TaxID=28090 RepID=UPI0001BBA926|nr:hypothetical protein [Acinetobacter lwoffii]EEY90102.1 hypothetical protein HMPREF0017_01028 [Acinetobacter lwoffii SH145]